MAAHGGGLVYAGNQKCTISFNSTVVRLRGFMCELTQQAEELSDYIVV